MAKIGHRQTKYRKEYDEQVYKLCLLNATDAQIASYFNVVESTLNLWKLKHNSFSESIKDGKVRADAEVAKSLHARAVGYSHPDVHISNYQGDITITDIVKHYPPDTAAAFIWLKNRQGWTDKKEVVLKDDRYTPEQRDAIRARLAERCLSPGAMPVLPTIDAEVVNVQEQG
jgi:dGTP triphosphohydrolase